MADSFDDAVRQFCDLKAFEGIAVVTESDPDDISANCKIGALIASVSAGRASRAPLGGLPQGADVTDAVVSRVHRSDDA